MVTSEGLWIRTHSVPAHENSKTACVLPRNVFGAFPNKFVSACVDADML